MKFSKFPTVFLKNLVLILFLLGFVACRKNDDWDSNKTFNGKYSSEVQKISASRVAPPTAVNDKLDFTAPIDQQTSRYTNAVVAVPEYYSSQQFYNQAVAPSGFRDQQELFENSYAPTINYPFRKIGVEFDAINVPSKDAYGVGAGMSDKEYLLVSRKLLQKNVDQINSEKTSDDIDNSNTLISEQRKIKRQIKMTKIFGSESVKASDAKKNDGDKPITATKKDDNKKNDAGKKPASDSKSDNTTQSPPAVASTASPASGTASLVPVAQQPAIPTPALPGNP